MPRPTWSGTVSFGLVSIPVELYPATEDRSVQFHQYEEGTTDRIRYKKVNERSGREVPNGRIVRGVEIKGKAVVFLTDEELDAIAPSKSQSIEITEFVNASELSCIYVSGTYYLGPKDDHALRAYSLLRTALEQEAKIGLARFVLRAKEHIVALRPEREVLVLETLHFADEIKDPLRLIPSLGQTEAPKARELELAKMLVDSMTEDWNLGKFKAEFRDQVEELVERKVSGKAVLHRPTEEPSAKVIDLTQALQKSLHTDRARTSGAGAGTRNSRSRPSRSDFSSMTKAQLVSVAAELQVPGRSKMNREQLQAALEAANPRRRRAS